MNRRQAFITPMQGETLEDGLERAARTGGRQDRKTRMKVRRLLFHAAWICVCLILCPVTISAQPDRESPWAEWLQGRAVAIIRHAVAPGLGDPPEFRIGDCGTQRNLSEEGRAQARRIGRFFRQKGAQKAVVYSSQWCRCVETARLINLGEVRELPVLNSFFQDMATGDAQTIALRKFIGTLAAQKPVILVTHQVNIAALTGVLPASGEIVIFRLVGQDRGKVLGRFKP